MDSSNRTFQPTYYDNQLPIPDIEVPGTWNGNSHSHLSTVDATEFVTNVAETDNYFDIDASAYDATTRLHDTTLSSDFTTGSLGYPATYLYGQRTAPPSTREYAVHWAPDMYNDFGLLVNTMHDSGMSLAPCSETDYSVSAEAFMLLPDEASTTEAGLANRITGESFARGSSR